MGLIGAAKRGLARLAINKTLKEYPMLKKLVDKVIAVLTWGPAGSKRAVAVVLGIAAIVLRHIDAAINEACAAALAQGQVCAVHLAGYAESADKLAEWVNGLSAAVDPATLILGVIALAGAWFRPKQ